MRVVLDTNIFISALLVENSLPAELIGHWRHGKFDLLSAREQLGELSRVTRYPKIKARLNPVLAGRLINEIRDVAVMLERLPVLDVSADPYDNYLLGIAVAGSADYLVTGEKNDLLSLKQHDGTKILTIRDFLILTKLLP
jgi:putative PIN family toxin of toxin-antitoxin system